MAESEIGKTSSADNVPEKSTYVGNWISNTSHEVVRVTSNEGFSRLWYVPDVYVFLLWY